jgi:hypothetical protein
MTDDPISHPLIDFPPLVTVAGRAFYVEHGETLRMHAAESIQAQALEDLTTALAELIPFSPTALEPKPQILEWGEDAVELAKANMPRRMQAFISSAVDNYQTYVTDLFAAALGVSSASVDDGLRDREYRGFSGKKRYATDRLGLALIEDPAVSIQVERAIALRNSLVHRRGIVDEKLLGTLRRTGSDEGFELGNRFAGNHHLAALTAVMEAVQDLDLRVMEKFGLPGVANDRTEWLKPLVVFRSMRPTLSVDTLNHYPDWPESV